MTENDAATPEHHRIAILGTGFAGLAMAVGLLEAGERDVVLFERDSEVGGTWRDNTYPGCACDVPSHLYSFSFAPNPDWHHSFSRQPQILDYLRRCADDFGVRPLIRFDHEVLDAAWLDDERRWQVTTNHGVITADIFIAGPGPLSEPALPEIPGLERFEGTTFHSARWNHDHDLSGERVAVIGTGASAIQFVPAIEPVVSHIDVYQRTPPWIVPRTDRPYRPIENRIWRRFPWVQRAIRAAIYWGRESFVLSFRSSRPGPADRLARSHLAKQVPDPVMRARLTPDYRIGCKRILISNDWYPTITRPDVDVISDGIAEVREHSVVTVDGTERPVDTIIFGTGFQVTDFPLAHRIRGRDGVLLSDLWKGSMEGYKGTTVHGFPNMFLLVGPNTGLGHTSIVYMIESQVPYVLGAVAEIDGRRTAALDVRADAQARFNADVQRRSAGTVWTSPGCRSWYLDANGRNTTLWPTFTFLFRRLLRDFDVDAYERLAPASPTARQP